MVGGQNSNTARDGNYDRRGSARTAWRTLTQGAYMSSTLATAMPLHAIRPNMSTHDDPVVGCYCSEDSGPVRDREKIEMRIGIGPCLLVLAAFAAHDARAVDAAIQYSGPIFDVHLHTNPPASVLGAPNPVTGVKAAANALALRDAVIQECRKYNVTRAVLNGSPGTLAKWAEVDPKRFILLQ